MGLLSSSALKALPRLRNTGNEERLPSIAKNTVLRDKVNDEQVRLAKRGPMMIRNPKKTAKGA